MKKLPVALLLVLIASFALTACGGSSDSSDSTAAETSTEAPAETEAAGGGAEAGGGGAATLTIDAADSGLAFSSDTAESEAGKVTLEFKNPQTVPHDVAIEDSAGKNIGETEVVSAGESTAVVDLKPGTYTYFCTIPGHREAGMEGTLTVK